MGALGQISARDVAVGDVVSLPDTSEAVHLTRVSLAGDRARLEGMTRGSRVLVRAELAADAVLELVDRLV